MDTVVFSGFKLEGIGSIGSRRTEVSIIITRIRTFCPYIGKSIVRQIGNRSRYIMKDNFRSEKILGHTGRSNRDDSLIKSSNSRNKGPDFPNRILTDKQFIISV